MYNGSELISARIRNHYFQAYYSGGANPAILKQSIAIRVTHSILLQMMLFSYEVDHSQQDQSGSRFEPHGSSLSAVIA